MADDELDVPHPPEQDADAVELLDLDDEAALAREAVLIHDTATPHAPGEGPVDVDELPEPEQA